MLLGERVRLSREIHDTLLQSPVGVALHCDDLANQLTQLAPACQDNTIRLWDVATHDEVAELRGHEDYVHAVAFSPDGTRLVSGSGDHTVRLWDTLSPQGRIRGPEAVGPKVGK